MTARRQVVGGMSVLKLMASPPTTHVVATALPVVLQIRIVE